MIQTDDILSLLKDIQGTGQRTETKLDNLVDGMERIEKQVSKHDLQIADLAKRLDCLEKKN